MYSVYFYYYKKSGNVKVDITQKNFETVTPFSQTRKKELYGHIRCFT